MNREEKGLIKVKNQVVFTRSEMKTSFYFARFVRQ